jgi:hypothetical protein
MKKKIKGFDKEIEQQRIVINKKFKPNMVIPKECKIDKEHVSSIKENITFLLLALLQDHQNELKSIREDLKRGRLDIVMMGLNRRLS